jgi:hypothetical protein
MDKLACRAANASAGPILPPWATPTRRPGRSAAGPEEVRQFQRAGVRVENYNSQLGTPLAVWAWFLRTKSGTTSAGRSCIHPPYSLTAMLGQDGQRRADAAPGLHVGPRGPTGPDCCQRQRDCPIPRRGARPLHAVVTARYTRRTFVISMPHSPFAAMLLSPQPFREDVSGRVLTQPVRRGITHLLPVRPTCVGGTDLTSPDAPKSVSHGEVEVEYFGHRDTAAANQTSCCYTAASGSFSTPTCKTGGNSPRLRAREVPARSRADPGRAVRRASR